MKAADARPAKRAEYRTTEVSREARDAIARICKVLVDDGVPEKKRLEHVHRAG